MIPTVSLLNAVFMAPDHTHRTFSTAFGTVTQVPVRLFLNDILPPLRHGLDATKVSNTLNKTGKRSSTHKPITLRNRWRGFNQDPALARRPEEQSFKGLEDVIAMIIQAGRLDAHSCRPSLSFHNNDRCEMYALNRDPGAFPDAYLSRGRDISWYTIAVSGEYKKTDSEEDQEDVSRIDQPISIID